MAQVAALQPDQLVAVIGESRQPQTCLKNDETALLSFFPTRTFLHLPTHTQRHVSRHYCHRSTTEITFHALGKKWLLPVFLIAMMHVLEARFGCSRIFLPLRLQHQRASKQGTE